MSTTLHNHGYGTFEDDKQLSNHSIRSRFQRIGFSMIICMVGLFFFVFSSETKQNNSMLSRTSNVRSENSLPNIIIILTDDQGYNDLGYQSTDLAQFTPTIDHLASNGIKLTNYYSQPLCTPSRAALFTGLYPIHTGMQHELISSSHLWGLGLEYKLLPQYLKELAGYKTHLVGKWHLGHYDEDHMPYNRGFDTFYGFLSGYISYFSHLSECGLNEEKNSNSTEKDCFFDLRNMSEPIRRKGEHSMYLFNDALKEVIGSHNTKDPLFLVYAPPTPHLPLAVPDAISTEYAHLLSTIPNERRRLFAGLTIMLDNTIKNMIEYLKESDLWDNSILIYASDNGADVSILGLGSNLPYRGTKGSLFEGGVHVPAFIHSPLFNKEQIGSTYNNLMHVTDWMPTIIEGILNVKNEVLKDGVNQWEGLVNINNNNDNIILPPRNEILLNADELNCNQMNMNISTSGIIFNNWKYIQHSQIYPLVSTPSTHDQSYEILIDTFYRDYLFDLINDPQEQNNLYATFPAIVQIMNEKILEYSQSSISSSYCDFDDTTRAHKVFDKTGFIGPWIFHQDDISCPVQDIGLPSEELTYCSKIWTLAS